MLEQQRRQQRLTEAGAGGHRRDHHPTADDELRVALEEVVGHRVESERPPARAAARGGQPHPSDQSGRELRRRQVGKPRGHLGRRLQHLDAGERPPPGLLALEQLRQQPAGDQHLHPGPPQHPPEDAVLAARGVAVEDVVEQQLTHHPRHHQVDLGPGIVHQHPAQPPGLRLDTQRHRPRSLGARRHAVQPRRSAGLKALRVRPRCRPANLAGCDAPQTRQTQGLGDRQPAELEARHLLDFMPGDAFRAAPESAP